MFLAFIPTLVYWNPEHTEDKHHLFIQITPAPRKDPARGWKNPPASQVGKSHQTV